MDDLDEVEVEEFTESGMTEGRFITAQALKNGGVILEVDNALVITYLKWHTVKGAFKRELGGNAKVKERIHNILVEFIPAHMQYTLQMKEVARRIEINNNMEEGMIEKIKWMRNPELTWSKTQLYVHAIVLTKCRYTQTR